MTKQLGCLGGNDMFGINDLFRFLYTTWDDYEDRLVENTKQGDYEIDTCFCNDTNKYETGISKLENDWIIVEEYNTKDEASIGHKKWVEFTKAEPKKAYSIELEEWEEF